MRPRGRRISHGEDDSAALGASLHDAGGHRADADEGGFDAIAAGDPDLAERAMRRHLEFDPMVMIGISPQARNIDLSVEA